VLEWNLEMGPNDKNPDSEEDDDDWGEGELDDGGIPLDHD
jgi:hypothetical protein